MRILLVESSSKFLSLAIASKDKILKTRNVELGRKLSSNLILEIKKILKSVKLAPEDLDGFAVGLGPGSFTSLRVGLATIKGLALALDKPVVGVSSLDVLEAGIPEDDPRNSSLCLLDAKRDLFYAAFYSRKNGVTHLRGNYLLAPLKDILKEVKHKTTIVGDGIKLLKEQTKLKSNYILESEEFWYPKAKNLLPLVIKKFKNKGCNNIDKIVPLYLYPENCQVTKISKKAKSKR
ncbi:MAG: tRNA (adenosine(37)-N6)-threonylcarbamoyltransferase complex dimerization subunit type 1 TsaB [Candidatus Zapsychrus exili]|nr:tRNA (adenosine(37)-N6)-threonylcarbamoyltransferase complex dimerization subunit type 1 TsaB [Candidatus Zapsychrus exili]